MRCESCPRPQSAQQAWGCFLEQNCLLGMDLSIKTLCSGLHFPNFLAWLVIKLNVTGPRDYFGIPALLSWAAHMNLLFFPQRLWNEFHKTWSSWAGEGGLVCQTLMLEFPRDPPGPLSRRMHHFHHSPEYYLIGAFLCLTPDKELVLGCFLSMMEIWTASVPGGFVSMAYMGPSKGLLKKCLEAGVVLMLIVDGTVFVPMHSGLKSLTEQLCVTISAGPKAGFFCDFWCHWRFVDNRVWGYEDWEEEVCSACTAASCGKGLIPSVNLGIPLRDVWDAKNITVSEN